MKVAIIGATGLVGRVMLEVLEERDFPVSELFPVASEKSVGTTVSFQNEDHKVIAVEKAVDQQPDVALFSAGSSVSKEWGPVFAEQGTYVIDNSSAWRMDSEIPLIIPEVNGSSLQKDHTLIANPNCSTTQLVMALAPVQRQYGIQRIVVSTYQSVTGSGKKAVNQLNNERANQGGEQDYPHPIDLNCIPHCDDFQSNGYTREEIKMVNETQKIFQDDTIHVSPTAVRVPVIGGHGESVNVTLRSSFSLDKIREAIDAFDGVTVLDDPSQNLYPMPRSSQGKDDVFVGRIRSDESHPRSLNLWIVSDNLRKGAATNTIQIAEYLREQEWLPAPSKIS